MLQREAQQNGGQEVLGTGCIFIGHVVSDGLSDMERHGIQDLRGDDKSCGSLGPGGGKWVQSLRGRNVFGAFGIQQRAPYGWGRV